MKNMTIRERSVLFPLLLLLSLPSCTEKAIPDLPGQGEALSTVLINSSFQPLFANLPNDSAGSETKGTAVMVPLQSVLDKAGQKKSIFMGCTVVQIPFSPEYSGQKAYFGNEPEGDPGETAVLKRFLVASEDGMFVVTMVTDYHYWRSHPGFDYLDKPDYTGAVVFSTVSGELIKVQAYDSGRISQADFVTAPESGGIGKGLAYILVYSEPAGTKSGTASDDGVLDSEGIAGRYTISIKQETEDAAWYWDPSSDTECLPEKNYTVKLSCDIPVEVRMTGSGTYTAGSTAIIGYTQAHNVKVLEVNHWTGDFAWAKSSRFSYKVTSDLESTAYFEAKKPFTDNSRHVSNPLLSMRIAASNVSMELADADEGIYANYYGGTFGETRTDLDGNPKRHDGLDLYAEVGTPVYALCSGVVTKAECGYGDEHVSNSYGNELRIEAREKNKTVVYQYAHLRGGMPFAVNPRTGQPFKLDDKVFQGDLIGYSGRSGNATNVPNPHLHLGVNAGGKWVDPKPYINGTYPSGRKSIDKSKGVITGIRRD